MRSSLLAVALGVSLLGCVGTIEGPSEGDDDSNLDPRNPGNPQNPGNPDPNTPMLGASFDNATVATELSSNSTLTLTLRASGGFSGAAALVGKAVDPTGAEIPGWTVTLDKSSVDVPADGTTDVVATVKIASDSAALVGTVKVEATTSLGTIASESEVTVAKQVTIPVAVVNNACVLPVGTTLSVKAGTKVRFLNTSATNTRVTIHMENRPGRDGLFHQPDPGVLPDTAFEYTTAVVNGALSGRTMNWYCHQPGGQAANNDPKILVVP